MKYTIIQLIVSIIVLVVLNGCSHKSENVDDLNDGVDEVIQVTDVVSGYMVLKDALVATDYDEARSAAVVFEKVVKSNVEASFEKALLSITVKLVAAENIEEQRKYFEQISSLIYALAENGAFDQTLYKQFCPMAFDNKGAYWLSLEENILNPYFGDRMLKCGYVEEIL